MTAASIAHVESAIRHRSLSFRAMVALTLACGAIAVLVSFADRYLGVETWGLPGDLRLAWPEIATQALGHFSYCFVVATTMAAIYELVVMRHLRAIARQVRNAAWLEDDRPVQLDRRWPGTSDDLERLVGALNEARQFGVETRSALTWRLARCRTADAERRDHLESLEAENAMLRSDLSEQASYMRSVAHTLGGFSVAAGTLEPVTGTVDAPNVHDLWSGGPARRGPDRDVDGLKGLADEMRAFASMVDDCPGTVPVDLEEIVRSVSNDLQGEVAAAGARVEFADLPVILGDPELLARLFRTLLADIVLRGSPDGSPLLSVTARVRDHLGLVHVRASWKTQQPLLASRKPARIGQDEPVVMLCRRLLRHHGGTLDFDPEIGAGVAEFTVPRMTRTSMGDASVESGARSD